MSQKSYNDQPGWDESSTITRKMNVHIPLKLQLVCNNIAKRVGGNEFSIFCRIEKREGNDIYLSDFYTIPEQTVSPGAIDYGADPDCQVDTVIHRHPDGFHVFSSVDEAYINRNFECSILYTKAGGFVHGIYNMKMSDDVKLRLDVEPIITDGLGVIDISMIKQKTYKPSSYVSEHNNSTFRPQYYSPSSIHDQSSLFDDPTEPDKSEKTPIERLKEKWAEEDSKRDGLKKKPTSSTITKNLEKWENSFDALKKEYIKEDDEDFDKKTVYDKVEYLKEKMITMEQFYDEALKGVSDDILGLRDDLDVLDGVVDDIKDELDGVEWVDEKEENPEEKTV